MTRGEVLYVVDNPGNRHTPRSSAAHCWEVVLWTRAGGSSALRGYTNRVQRLA